MKVSELIKKLEYYLNHGADDLPVTFEVNGQAVTLESVHTYIEYKNPEVNDAIANEYDYHLYMDEEIDKGVMFQFKSSEANYDD